jgi:lipid-binding SYLF domain-containing protein
MKTEVLIYSRARGVFAGLTVNGAVIEQDADDTRAFYGHDSSFRPILQGDVRAPDGSKSFMAAIRKFAAQAEAAKASNN